MLLHLLSFTVIPLVHGYSWKFENNPTQCGTLRATIEDDTGTPPYRLLLVPGVEPWPTKYQGMKPAPQLFTFPSGANERRTLEFQLRYPANTQIVATVGDANGFATGGTSMPWTVRNSSDYSCLDNTWTGTEKWPWFHDSTQQDLYSCEPTQFFWKWPNPNITGNVHFTALYPGGLSINISTTPLYPLETIENNTRQAFNWTVPFYPDSQVILLSGDDSSMLAPGGMVSFTVKAPRNASKVECPLNMFTRTPGIPAGGDPNVDLGRHSTNHRVAAIASGTVAGFAVIVGLAAGFARNVKRGPVFEDENSSYTIDETGPIDPFPSSSPQPISSNHSSPGVHKSRGPGPIQSPNSVQVQYIRHQDSEDVITTQTVDLPPDYNSDRPIPSRSSLTMISSDLASIYHLQSIVRSDLSEPPTI
ncbi:hypothetical protein DL96DRAFT_1571473 [Flagelloscypha sp. PMI_526]|nr:hypothetical protein DL96DRAFT_1571473 [Flagelloscypha sp. PMI_526]